jgi:hypothetical protein
MIYQITYQFERKLVDQDAWIKFYDLMKDIGDDWFHVLEHACWVYFKDDSITPEYIHNKIMEIIDYKDILFIISPLSSETYGWLATNAWKWREKYL